MQHSSKVYLLFKVYFAVVLTNHRRKLLSTVALELTRAASQTFFDAEPFLVQKLSGEPQILIILYGHNINIIYKAGSFNLSQKFIA